MVDKLKQQLGSAYVGEFVTLYQIDCSNLGGSKFYFTPSSGTPVVFDSIQYNPLPISIDGLERQLDQAPSRPTMSVDNIGQMLMASVLSLGDLVGAKVTVIRTMGNFLDGHADADPTERFPVLRYTVIRMQALSRTMIKFVLATDLDRPITMLPRRQCLKSDVGEGSLFTPGMLRTKA